MSCIKHDFAKSGVGVYYVAQVVDGGIFVHQCSYFMYDVCRVGAIKVAADYDSLLVSEKLDKAVALVHCQCFAVGTEEGFVCLCCDAVSFTVIGGQSYGGSFGIGEYCGRHDVKSDLVLTT